MNKNRSALPTNLKTSWLSPAIVTLLVLAGLFVLLLFTTRPDTPAEPTASLPPAAQPETEVVHSERRPRPEYAIYRAPDYARDHSFHQETVLVWGGEHEFTEGLRRNSLSNIRRTDYAGQAACKKCHAENHDLWSNHAHRWMNAEANDQSVMGDFSNGERARMEYRGGVAEFYRTGGDYMMKLSRGGVAREFKIHRTLGSRVHQYYIGVLHAGGPEPDEHPLRTTEHVLPFGFELTMREWIPIVHATGQDGPDSNRDDPFEIPSRLPYDTSCSVCHTTPPMGNLMLAMFKRFAAYTPRKLHFEGSNYVDEMHPGEVRLKLAKDQPLLPQYIRAQINDLTEQAQELMHRDNAVELGIACEACHLGAKQHALDEKIKPPFFPSGPYVLASGESQQQVWGRTDANKNFICARCHSGKRPQYAAGMATWNSTEYTDAMRGHCYHPLKAEAHGMESLTCVSCHNPHETIGRRWTKTAAEDQQSCLKCHEQYRDPAVLEQHTHHSAGEGSQCMNCHMPRINEGMGDMVRTHTIFSPTNVQMLEANQPNACNMCHVEQSIDWTLQFLGEWYGLQPDANLRNTAAVSYSNPAIEQSYSDRSQPAALGWLQSSHSATRLVGADVLLKAKSAWALPALLRTLDDPYLQNRQFTVQRLRDYFEIDPARYGYKLYMTEEERQEPIDKMLKELTGDSRVIN